MPSITKSFTFLDYGSWVFTAGSDLPISRSPQANYSIHQGDRGRRYDYIQSGNLYCECTPDGTIRNPGLSYWEWTGVPTELGVPSGQTITSIRATYACRFRFFSGHNSGRNTGAYFSNNQYGTGPFEVRNSSGVLQYTLSGPRFCPSRTAAQYSAYPFMNVIAGRPLGTGLIPTNWLVITGDIISISWNSGTTLKLRLNMQFPPFPAWGADFVVRMFHRGMTLVFTY